MDTGRQKELRERRGLERPPRVPSSGEVSRWPDSGQWAVGGRNLGHQLCSFRPNTTKHLAMIDQLKPQMEPQSSRYYPWNPGQVSYSLNLSKKQKAPPTS